MTKHAEHTRALDVEGAYNVRDLGGYETDDGRMTRWGKYLRADTLANLTSDGVETLISYGISNIIDLRRSSDLQFRPEPLHRQRVRHLLPPEHVRRRGTRP